MLPPTIAGGQGWPTRHDFLAKGGWQVEWTKGRKAFLHENPTSTIKNLNPIFN